jgi:hypothetical protein
MSDRPAIEKTTLGQAVQMGLLTPDGEPVRAVSAMQDCWIVWPESVDEPACVYLYEGDALIELDRLSERDAP